MTFWQLVSNNWTKILGTLSTMLTTLMTLIASGAFEGLLEPSVIKWLGIAGMLIGSATVGVGFNNSAKARVAEAMETAIKAEIPPTRQSGFARPLMLALLLAVSVPAALSLQACATNATKPQDVISIACSPSDAYLIERCAEAVGDVYEVFQGRALEIVTDPVTPADVKLAIQKLDRELTPAVRTLLQTSIAYVQLRDLQDPNSAAKRAQLALQLADVQPKVQTLPKL